MGIGKIKKVNLRELWDKEPKFTTWLSENIDYLNDKLDFDISVESTEESVGRFFADIFGTDNHGRNVIIENQLEKTDHDHLGKVMTYFVNLNAKVGIWIVSEVVNEHLKVIDWLNENSSADTAFYLVKLEAISIEPNNVLAPSFTIITGPTEDIKMLGKTKSDSAEKRVMMREFWNGLLEKMNKKTRKFSSISASDYNWIGSSCGSRKTGLSYNFTLRNAYYGCEIYFSHPKANCEQNINKQRFDALEENKDEIENEFGKKLKWYKIEDNKTCRIGMRFMKKNCLKDKNKWDYIQDTMVDNMIKLEDVFGKYIKDIK